VHARASGVPFDATMAAVVNALDALDRFERELNEHPADARQTSSLRSADAGSVIRDGDIRRCA